LWISNAQKSKVNSQAVNLFYKTHLTQFDAF